MYTYLKSHEFIFYLVKLFFGEQPIDQVNNNNSSFYVFYAIIILLFIFCHAWRGSKWSSVREKTTKYLDN